MKRTEYRLVRVIACVAILASAGHLLAGDDPGSRLPRGERAFEVFSASGLDLLAPYAKPPDEKLALPGKDYPRAVREFDWWCRYALKSDWAPDAAFIREHVRLIPAGNRNGRDDAAFLSYEVAGKILMVVQTGGVGARMWIFAHDRDKAGASSPDEAAARAQNAIRCYLSGKVRSHVPAAAAKKVEAIYVGEVTSTPAQKAQGQVNHARWYAGDGEICLSIQKIDFEGTRRAGEPLPNEWFSWGKEGRSVERTPTESERNFETFQKRDKAKDKPPTFTPGGKTGGAAP